MCFGADLAVDRDFQRQGIGRALLEQVRRAVGPSVSLGLFAAPEAEAYYPHIGFTSAGGWRLPRSR
jgi:predicted N-acetyltransferase YhbS